MIDYLSGDDVIVAGTAACGFEPLITQPAQFEANVARPATMYFGQEAFPTIWTKASALLHSFATTQTLADGNKRTAWASCWLMLRLNHAIGSFTNPLNTNAAEELVHRVAPGKCSIEEIADTLHQFVYPQLGIYGKLPAGFQISRILSEFGQSMVGVGKIPGGTSLVYVYLANLDSSILEIVMTLAEARNFAKHIYSLVEHRDNSETVRSFELSVQGFLHHSDLANGI